MIMNHAMHSGFQLQRILLLLLLIMMCSVRTASASELLSLDEAISIAMEHNPDIRVARGEERIARNKVNIGNAGLLPSIDLVGSVSYQNTEDAQLSSMDESTTTSAKLQASYTLFDGFGNIYTFRKLKTAGRLGSLQAKNRIEQTILDVSEAYYRFADATAQLDVARKALSISDERLRRARLRSEYGQANSLEVLSATVDANADSVASMQAGLEYNAARRSLNLLLHRPVSTLCSVETDVQFVPDMTRERVLEGARQSFAEYRIAEESVRQAQHELGIARSDFFPEISMQANYGYSQTDPGLMVDMDDPSEGFSASLTMTLPLFNGFRSSIAHQNARIALQNSQVRLEQAAIELEGLVGDTWDAYRNSLDILDFQQKNLETAELNFRRTNELYVLGQATNTTFREAQLNLISARQAIASARYEAKLLEIRLMRIGGFLVFSEK
ncbi:MULTISPECIES: TolC family protein [unclassified Prosthecochloris]|uniref:TolC family protein n=1 Tax=unclassified Prosthecochloris TaxID=2632826 RepID=UPI001FCA04AB|nr:MULTISPECIES: TolC family protein [unclassified Prosthecochloris]